MSNMVSTHLGTTLQGTEYLEAMIECLERWKKDEIRLDFKLPIASTSVAWHIHLTHLPGRRIRRARDCSSKLLSHQFLRLVCLFLSFVCLLQEVSDPTQLRVTRRG